MNRDCNGDDRGNCKLRLSLLTIIMSSDIQPETNRIHNKSKLTGSLEAKISSPLHLSRAPTPSSFEMDSSSDNATM